MNRINKISNRVFKKAFLKVFKKANISWEAYKKEHPKTKFRSEQEYNDAHEIYPNHDNVSHQEHEERVTQKCQKIINDVFEEMNKFINREGITPLENMHDAKRPIKVLDRPHELEIKIPVIGQTHGQYVNDATNSTISVKYNKSSELYDINIPKYNIKMEDIGKDELNENLIKAYDTYLDRHNITKVDHIDPEDFSRSLGKPDVYDEGEDAKSRAYVRDDKGSAYKKYR